MAGLPPARLAPPVWRQAALQAGCFMMGAVVAATLLLARNPAAQATSAPAVTQVDAGVEQRMAALEARLQAVLAERSQAPGVARAPEGERFFAAALHLQATIASPRPWLREYELVAALAPPGTLARPLREVLASHAARGLPTEFELRERFTTLAPLLATRAPAELGFVQRMDHWLRGGFAAIGLAAPPGPSGTEAALDSIQEQLRRGNLAGAATDAAALPAAVQPLLAGWLAQARARLAAEQAIRETLLRALSPEGRPT